MVRKIRLLALTLMTLVLILSSVWDVPRGVAAAPGPFDELTISIDASPEEQVKLMAEWTREARMAAKPLSMPMAEATDIKPEVETTPLGVPGTSSGGLADPRAEIAAQQAFPNEWAALKELGVESTQPAGTAGIYTSYLGNYFTPAFHTEFPYKAIGRLYISGGGYCSASVISPQNIIVTAAHCVYDTDTNQWKRGWIFVPADRAGAAPYGSFPWRSARVLNAWINAPNSTTGRPYDVAVISLGNNSAGRSVTYYAGWLGRAWNYSYVQNLHAVGYPSNLNNGQYTYLCAAESFYQSSEVIGMGCNMMHGSSGGPWIMTFAPYQSGANNYVDSVVSGGLYGSTWGNTFYGARFNSNNIVTLCTAQGC